MSVISFSSDITCTSTLHGLQIFKKTTSHIIVGDFRGRNFHEFHGLRATHESFLHKILRHATPTYTIDLSFHEKFSPRNAHFQ